MRFNLHWQNGSGIRVQEHPGIKGSGASGQVKEAKFWERKYCVIDASTKTRYWLNRGSLIDRINTTKDLHKGYSWDYLGWFDRTSDHDIQSRLKGILKQEARDAPITVATEDIMLKIFSYDPHLQLLGRISQISHLWQQFMHHRGWQLLAKQFSIPALCFDQLRNYVLETECDYELFFQSKMQIAPLNHYPQINEARSALIVWKKLLRNRPIIFKTQSFAELIAKRREFFVWCRNHRKTLELLEELDLSSHKLTHLPPEIGLLTGLKWLHLEQNKLSTLPPELGNLSWLRALNLGDNKLTTLPPELSKLSQLRILILNDNNLTVLPTKTGKFSKLRCLVLKRDNNWTPRWIKMVSLGTD